VKRWRIDTAKEEKVASKYLRRLWRIEEKIPSASPLTRSVIEGKWREEAAAISKKTNCVGCSETVASMHSCISCVAAPEMHISCHAYLKYGITWRKCKTLESLRPVKISKWQKWNTYLKTQLMAKLNNKALKKPPESSSPSLKMKKLSKTLGSETWKRNERMKKGWNIGSWRSPREISPRRRRSLCVRAGGESGKKIEAKRGENSAKKGFMAYRSEEKLYRAAETSEAAYERRACRRINAISEGEKLILGNRGRSINRRNVQAAKARMKWRGSKNTSSRSIEKMKWKLDESWKRVTVLIQLRKLGPSCPFAPLALLYGTLYEYSSGGGNRANNGREWR